jgi:DNA-binding NarL/FixJ family response regulator
MRVVIVGAPPARARLHARLPEGIEVVGEARTIREARALGAAADAFLVADGAREEREAVDIEPLTTREHEVLELLALGLANKSIAGRLGISDQTVKFHVASICGKLGAVNRTDAVHRALQYGLLPL